MMERRRFIFGLPCLLTFGSGCLGTTTHNPKDIIVYNDTNELQKITINVKNKSSNETLLEDTFELKSNSDKQYDTVFTDSVDIVNVRVEDGPENKHEWARTGDASLLNIVINSNSIDFFGSIA